MKLLDVKREQILEYFRPGLSVINCYQQNRGIRGMRSLKAHHGEDVFIWQGGSTRFVILRGMIHKEIDDYRESF